MAGGVSRTASLQPCWRSISRSAARRATVVWAKAGRSVSRSFHQSASDPCGSMSISTTGPAPASWACTARWPERVDLPDPPFCEANARKRTTVHLKIHIRRDKWHAGHYNWVKDDKKSVNGLQTAMVNAQLG